MLQYSTGLGSIAFLLPNSDWNGLATVNTISLAVAWWVVDRVRSTSKCVQEKLRQQLIVSSPQREQQNSMLYIYI